MPRRGRVYFSHATEFGSPDVSLEESLTVTAHFTRDRAVVLALAFLLAMVAFLLSSIPYSYAVSKAPEGTRFIGQLVHADDINSYYSFIRQAASGHLIFRNAMTHIPHAPAFVNLEFLVAGWGMALTGCSTQALYEGWRVLAAFTALLGFATLTLVALRTQRERIIALLMFAFGGGFGWFAYLLQRWGVLRVNTEVELHNPAMDLTVAFHPFGQIVINPHFALPHGIFLLFVASYIVAEKTGKRSWYCVSALVALLQSLIRPYDLISMFAILPAFVVLETVLTRRVDFRRAIDRLIPLFVTGPLLLYYVWIFSFHPIFKYWASQGVQPPVPVILHYLAFGFAGVLCLWRVCNVKRYPLAESYDRLLLVWVIVVFALFHGNRVLSILPYTPQLGIPLASPMILLGVAVFRKAPANTSLRLRPAFVIGMAIFLIVNALSSPLFIARACELAANNRENYISDTDEQAVEWLKSQVKEADVVLSDYPTGTTLSQLVTARVVLGHWALTPHLDSLAKEVDRFLRGEMEQPEADSLLQRLGVNYVFVTARRDHKDSAYFEALPGLQEVFKNDSVAVFARESAG